MKIYADKWPCEANGLCAQADPELFPLDDEGYIAIGPDGMDVPAGKQDPARRGVSNCPRQVLRIA